MTTSPAPAEPNDVAADIPRESARTILFQFVIFPLGVVAVGVLIFLLFGMLASEDHSIREYVNDIRSGSSHRRWQAAYELSKSLKRGEAKQYPELVTDISALYREAKNDDPKVRRYLSMVLGTIGDRRATPVLLEGLNDPDADNRVFAILALADLADPRSVPALTQAAQSDDPGIRKTAVYALGRVGDEGSREPLVRALSDGTADVRYNAAIALSRMGDTRAIGVVREMLDRSRLDAVQGMREDQKEAILIAGIAAGMQLAPADTRPLVERLGNSDSSLRVRAAAKEALR